MELSEEKKAIEILKEVASDEFSTIGDDISPKMAQNILNVISRQQKEIEEKNIAINKMSKDISSQLEEIEEKTTIIMAGAEKVKQLEKGNRSLMESRIKWKNRYYKEKAKNKEYISKDKIREKIEEIESFDKAMHQKNGQFTILVLQGLLKEEDGDHIPRID